MERRLTIGELAERCGLSRSALRFYDHSGLLRPCSVDPDTGYRRYAHGQLEDARLIRRLRTAELPVELVRAYLEASPERRRQILETHADAVRRRAADVEAAVGALRHEIEHDAGRWCQLAAGAFAAALQQVSFAVADPAVRSELSAVWVETRDGSLRLVGTDSYRMAVRDLVPDAVGPHALRGVIDPARARALAATGSLTLAQRADGAIEAADGGSRHPLGGPGADFPDYEHVLEAVPVGRRFAVTRAAFERALGGIPDALTPLALRFAAGGLTVAAAGHRARIAGRWVGEPLELLLSRRFLTEAVAATAGPDLVIEAAEPLRPLTLRSADTGTFAVLTMPIAP